MNIQFSVLDPDLLSEASDKAIIVGIVTAKEKINDYDVYPMVFDLQNDGLYVAKSLNHESLLERKENAKYIRESSFHENFTKPIWKTVQSDKPAGEIAFVKTLFPETPAGFNSYVIFGIIKGENAPLKSISGSIFQGLENELQSFGSWQVSRTKDTGRKAEHTKGSPLGTILRDKIWGFGDVKYGMRSMVSIQSHTHMLENRGHLIEHGKNMDGYFGGRADKGYIHFLREMNKFGEVGDDMWIDSERSKELDQLSLRCAKLSIESEEIGHR